MGSFDFAEVINNTIVYIGVPIYVTCAFSNPSTYLKIELLGHLLPPVPAVEDHQGVFSGGHTISRPPTTPEDVQFSAYTWYLRCFL